MLPTLQKKKCLAHKAEVTTIDLNSSVQNEEKYLCTKCLIGKINTQKMALVDETEEMINEIEETQNSLQKKQISLKNENYKKIQKLFQNYEEQVLTIMKKINQNLEDKIKLTDKELQQTSANESKKFEDQVEILSKYYLGNLVYQIPFQILYNQEQESEFFKTIEQQLLSLTNNKPYHNLVNSLQIKNEQNKNEAALNIIFAQKLQNDQTPSLKIICKKHSKQIILLSLDPSEPSNSRKFCIDCVCQSNPIKYTSLEEADRKWKEYQEQSQNLSKKYVSNRNSKQKQILLILQDIKDKYNSFLDEQINKIKNQQSEINQLEIDNIMKHSIYNLEESQIDEIVRILTQSDVYKDLIEKQNNQSTQDSIFYQNISQDIQKHIHFDLQASKKIINISKSDFFELQLYSFYDEDVSEFDQYNSSSILLKELDQIEKELKLKKIELEQIQIQIKYAEEKKHQLQLELKDIIETSKIYENQKKKEGMPINKKLLENSKIIQREQQLEDKYEELDNYKIKILPESFQKLLNFSNQFKCSDCLIAQEGKIAECISGFGFCICEQVIPKVGTTKFAFQVIEKSGLLFIGIGIREIIKEKGFGSNYKLNCGAYLIAHDAKVFSNHDSQIDGKQLSFNFGQNDIVIIEVNMDQKKIMWTKYQSKELCVIDIETTKDLYPSVLLHSKAKIMILNDIPQ